MQPAIPKCFYCCKDKNEILLARTMTDHAQSKVGKLHGKIIDMEPCPSCASLMKMGVILITIDDQKSGKNWNQPPAEVKNYHGPAAKRPSWVPSPYRTGGWFVVTDETIEKMINPPEMAQWALNHRFMFIEEEAARQMDLYDIEPKYENPDCIPAPLEEDHEDPEA
jgi:hypothetical protein